MAGTRRRLKRGAQLGGSFIFVALKCRDGAQPGHEQFRRPAPGLEVAAEVHAAHHALVRELVSTGQDARPSFGQQVGE